MKTVLFAGLLALASFSASANKNGSYNATQSFRTQFGKVEQVTWSESSNNMMRATFVADGDVINAFFSYEGEFVASTVDRNINDLPAKLKSAVQQQSSGSEIVEIVELQGDSEHAYFVKIRSKDGDKILKGYSNGYLRAVTL